MNTDMNDPVNGLMLIDKPQGWTSFDVVAKIRGQLRAAARAQGSIAKIKVGHTGTLDPMATGLLVLAIGAATKQVPVLTKQDKVYLAQVTLGARSNTDDAEGQITPVSDSKPTQQQVADVLQQFVGDIQQVPPQFSAIKVAGQRAYAAARKGDTVELAARPVHIYQINDIEYAYPHVRFTAHVGSGTYIRSLARDVGEQLGTGAYLSTLRRTRVGDFSIEDAQQIPGAQG